ncbi:hypothetical protein BC938DRAFT_476352 [Jimgerdemannia flammicorona]|uniref:Uncharacterized protein n=1 Tax=Jimgerdemannia flammicorona TaxID=994334 RepID=A0A433QQP0_9FUNG|nr:hypothetical protein BC938DRAFT_476352 [Jimgerdemannia flammicorona]
MGVTRDSEPRGIPYFHSRHRGVLLGCTTSRRVRGHKWFSSHQGTTLRLEPPTMWFGEAWPQIQSAVPCVLFDEVDSQSTSGEEDAVELARMDGMCSTYNVFVLGATNRPEQTDSASAFSLGRAGSGANREECVLVFGNDRGL